MFEHIENRELFATAKSLISTRTWKRVQELAVQMPRDTREIRAAVLIGLILALEDERITFDQESDLGLVLGALAAEMVSFCDEPGRLKWH